MCKTDDDCYPSEFCDEEKGVCEVSRCKRLNGRIKVYKISNAINDSKFQYVIPILRQIQIFTFIDCPGLHKCRDNFCIDKACSGRSSQCNKYSCLPNERCLMRADKCFCAGISCR